MIAPLLSPAKVAEELGVSERSARTYMRPGRSRSS
jgi:hypothetical protein